jgi:hypothetical protein
MDGAVLIRLQPRTRLALRLRGRRLRIATRGARTSGLRASARVGRCWRRLALDAKGRTRLPRGRIGYLLLRLTARTVADGRRVSTTIALAG